MQNAKRKVQNIGTALRLYCLPLMREVAKSLILTEGEIVLLLTKSLPQSASQTAPSSEGAKEYVTSTSQ